MNRGRTHYTSLGLLLMLGGSSFGLVAWLIIDYIPLAALGMAAVILGAVSWGLGRTLPRVSMETAEILLEAGLDNITALIEELGLRSQAIYLPSSMTGGLARALIPVGQNGATPKLPPQLERRLLVRFGQGAADFGLLVGTPGSTALPLLEVPTSATMDDLERALTSVLVGSLDLAEAVRVHGGDGELDVDLVGCSLTLRPHPAFAVLGSPLASIAAAVAAEVLRAPVTFYSEVTNGKHHSITLRPQDQVVT